MTLTLGVQDFTPATGGMFFLALATLEKLLNVLAREQVRVLIPGSDPELSALASAREQLFSAGVLPIVGGADAVGLCRDKLAACRFFRAHGLPFVPTVPAGEGLRLAGEIGFPLVIKPVGGSASRGVHVVFDEEQLRQYADQEGMIVQEYLVPQNWGKARQELVEQDVVQGYLLRQEDEISIQVLLDHEGNLLGQFTSRNVLKQGVPVLVDPWPHASVEEPAREMACLLAARGLVGPCNFQCKVTDRGPVFFEVNPRFTGITAVRAAMGFNEVEAVLRRALFDEPLEAVRQRLHVPDHLVCSRYVTEMILPRADLEAARTCGQVGGSGCGRNL